MTNLNKLLVCVDKIVNKFSKYNIDKEELRGECLLALATALNKFNGNGNIEGYCGQLIYFRAIDFLRVNGIYNKNDNLRPVFVEEIERTENKLANHWKYSHAKLRWAVSQLPNLQKQAIIDMYWNRLLIKESAKKYKVSESAIGNRLHKAKKTLKQLLYLSYDN